MNDNEQQDLDLSANDQALLASLINPDEAEDKRYTLGPDNERSILATMIGDYYFLIQCRDLVRPGYFISEHRELLCQVLFDYFDQYKQIPPRQILLAEVQARLKRMNSKQPMACLAELHMLEDLYEPHQQNRDWLLDQVEEFAKVQAMREAYLRTLDLLFKPGADKWAKIWDIVKQPQLITRHKDEGLDYFGSLRERWARLREQKVNADKFTVGVPELDAQINGGPCRGELYGFVGGSGTGKSLMMTQAAVKNVGKGWKVLYYSLEMKPDKIGQRFDAMFSQFDINQLLALSDEELERPILDGIARFGQDHRRLIIKQFPAGGADTTTLRAHTARLRLGGFTPDVVIVDYVGEMKDHPGMKTYESRYRTCRDLRGWATEEDFLCLTGMQPNRGSKAAQEEEKVLQSEHLADSFDQIRIFDGVWSINQSKAQREMNLGIFADMKIRDGESGKTFSFHRSPTTLMFNVIDKEEFKRQMGVFQMKKQKDNNEEAAERAEEGRGRGRGRFKPNGAGEDDR